MHFHCLHIYDDGGDDNAVFLKVLVDLDEPYYLLLAG